MSSKADMLIRRYSKFLTVLAAFSAAVSFIMLCILLHVRPDQLIGAAFCHQMEARSPLSGFPFCYRCSGLFSGILWGMIFSLLRHNYGRVLSMQTVFPIAASFIIFLSDIINKTEYIPVRFYQDRTVIRFLSAYPLGFFLSKMIVSLSGSLFGLHSAPGSRNIYITGIALSGSCLIAYFAIFSRNLLILRMSGFMISAGSLFFLLILYSILVKCIGMLQNNDISLKSCLCASIFPALFQICVLGSLHLYLFSFDQLFS